MWILKVKSLLAIAAITVSVYPRDSRVSIVTVPVQYGGRKWPTRDVTGHDDRHVSGKELDSVLTNKTTTTTRAG